MDEEPLELDPIVAAASAGSEEEPPLPESVEPSVVTRVEPEAVDRPVIQDAPVLEPPVQQVAPTATTDVPEVQAIQPPAQSVPETLRQIEYRAQGAGVHGTAVLPHEFRDDVETPFEAMPTAQPEPPKPEPPAAPEPKNPFDDVPDLPGPPPEIALEPSPLPGADAPPQRTEAEMEQLRRVAEAPQVPWYDYNYNTSGGFGSDGDSRSAVALEKIARLLEQINNKLPQKTGYGD